jgi:hypothetical protein
MKEAETRAELVDPALRPPDATLLTAAECGARKLCWGECSVASVVSPPLLRQ